MEEPPEGQDGSSIKPVSSLRSHFEQMANARSARTAPTALSPQPTGSSIRCGNRPAAGPASGSREEALFDEALRTARSKDGEGSALQRPRRNSQHYSPSPTRNIRPRPASTISPRPLSTITPAVTIEPPQSPPKSKAALNLTLFSTPTYLQTDAPLSSASSKSSPGHFRIPSRPNTPIVEQRRSPRLSASQPPSPPPPRRSGEMRREASVSLKGKPPPVNRAEKPKIASKPVSLGKRTEAATLDPGHSPFREKSSPFSTPPGSEGSPSPDLPAPAFPSRPRPKLSGPHPRLQRADPRGFEPPPLHHSVVTRREKQEKTGLGRGLMSPQTTGDQRPALPTRPLGAPEPPKLRALATNTNTMPPPPPRPSMDRQRPTVVTKTDMSTPEYAAAPPKRVFSTPTSTQIETPTRSHGRSMTVDRTSDRTPAEFRTPARSLEPVPSRGETRSLVKEMTLHPNFGEYPDAAHSNRRAPWLKGSPREIPTKYDTKVVDVCGQFVCTSGHFTRVWSLLDGELVMSLQHTEGVKIISIAFKPTAEIKDEGLRLWLGNSIGELTEVDVPTSSVVGSKTGAHTRREIIKMYRHSNEMWTLDDGGTLHLWGPDSSGSANLANNPVQSFRVPKGHTFSMVVGDELWHAAGKEVRVFVPTLDGSTQFQVLARPLVQPSTGDITSGSTIASQPNKAYFGHADGKISIYSRRDYSCLGVVNISMYKITTLAGVDGSLWAGFSTGMVYVYDTRQSPWTVEKDWQAHDDPVVKILSDDSSFYSLDRAQVISLGQDNTLRIWDGLLQEDWMENQMQSQEAEYCTLNPIKALVMTWNAGASTPYHLRQKDQDSAFFRNILRSSDSPDIIVFGFQELVDLENKKTVTKSFFKSKKKDPSAPVEHMSHQYRDWRDFLTQSLDDYMPRSDLYHLLHTANLVGLFTCIYVKASLRERIRSVCAAEVKRGLGGLGGNKGALVVRFVLDDTSLCFINCHLAAGQTQTKDRNTDITTILEGQILPIERDPSVRQDSYTGGGDGSMILDHEICILNGDLNYRIDTMGRDTVVSAVKANNLGKLLERDQLLASRRKNPWFKLRAFNELPITFAPTYKYDVGTDNYDTSEKKRAPAWCDRILYRGRDQDRVQQVHYERHEVRVSDHRPVTGFFQMVVKSISPKKRAMAWEENQRRLLERKEKLGREARANYLTNILGYDAASCKQLIQMKEKTLAR